MFPNLQSAPVTGGTTVPTDWQTQFLLISDANDWEPVIHLI